MTRPFRFFRRWGLVLGVCGCHGGPGEPTGATAGPETLVLSLTIAPQSVSVDGIVTVHMTARNPGVLPVRVRVSCTHAGLTLRRLTVDGSVVLFIGPPCRFPGSSTARIAPGDSVTTGMIGGARILLPPSPIPGVYWLRIVYDTLDGEVVGPQVSLTIMAP